MKRLFIILAILFFTFPVFANDFTKSITFNWDQNVADLPSLKEWGLYVMSTSGGPKSEPIPVPYTTGSGPFISSTSFTVTGVPGSTVRKYFVLDSVSKNGSRSVGFSNEVFYDFVIPFAPTTVPLSLTVKATIVP